MAGLQKINWGQIDTTNVPNEIKVELGSLNTPIDKLYVKNIVGFDGNTSGFTSGVINVTVDNTTPPNPIFYKNGDIWIDSIDQIKYTLYDDGDKKQWVEYF